jgi:Amt family ammonium transporter
MVTEVKRRLGYDDSLDVFGVHGTGGVIGALLTGVFATQAVNPIFKDEAGAALPVGFVDGNAAQVLNQLAGVGITVAVAVAGTLVLLKLVDAAIGLRVGEAEEARGLDLSQHGEQGYHADLDLVPFTPAAHAAAVAVPPEALTEPA